jgi:hypothetical protein
MIQYKGEYIMRVRMDSLFTGVLCSCALLVTGTLLAGSAVYELPQGQWEDLRGGATNGYCQEGSSGTCGTVNCHVSGEGCYLGYTIENYGGYFSFGCITDPAYGECEASNPGLCGYLYACTYSQLTCSKVPSNNPGQVIASNRGCEDDSGTKGTP